MIILYMCLFVTRLQVVCLGMTTNEQLNRGRYRHFQARGGRSPFTRGPLLNCAHFFRCRLCGLLPPRDPRDPRDPLDPRDPRDPHAAADTEPMLSPHHYV